MKMSIVLYHGMKIQADNGMGPRIGRFLGDCFPKAGQVKIKKIDKMKNRAIKKNRCEKIMKIISIARLKNSKVQMKRNNNKKNEKGPKGGTTLNLYSNFLLTLNTNLVKEEKMWTFSIFREKQLLALMWGAKFPHLLESKFFTCIGKQLMCVLNYTFWKSITGVMIREKQLMCIGYIYFFICVEYYCIQLANSHDKISSIFRSFFVFVTTKSKRNN
jgi:hypothetical protein